VNWTTYSLALSAVLAVLAAVLVARHRRAQRAAALPPLVFEVHDRPAPRLRPAGFRAAPPLPSPARGVAAAMPGYLPGRLEIVAGPHAGEAVRFPRLDGVASYTLGRGGGPPVTHIVLPVRSVSVQHARMQHVNGRWRLSSLSVTDPVLVNAEPLDVAAGARWLVDGDLLDVGELALRFRDR